MKELYSSPNTALLHIVHSMLESHEISCKIKNEMLNPIVGDIPFDQAWPQLWVVDESKYDEAQSLINAMDLSEDAIPSFCPECDSEQITVEKQGDAFTYTTFKCTSCNNVWHKRY